jgi:DNA topoisomerase I
MKKLVIVEASGKVDSLKRELKTIGLFADVVATVGHIAENPRSLVPIALDEDLHELSYGFREDRGALIEKIRRAAVDADRIFIATDDDEQGDVIAWDVARLLSEQAQDMSDRLFRVRLRAITGPELQSAFTGHLSQQFEPYARNGICLRVLDRAIGGAFTQVSGRDVVPVGRVQSALLAAIAEEPPVAGLYTLTAKAGDGAVFRGEVPIHSAKELAACERAAAALEAGQGRILDHVELEASVSAPWGYEQVVAEVSERLKVPVDQAADLFQEAYEKGRVSYPRVRSGAYTREAVEVAAALARHNRCSFDGSRLRTREGDKERGTGSGDQAAAANLPAHEAPRVYDEEMVLGRPLNVLAPVDAVAVLVARNMIESAQVRRVRRITVEAEGLTLTLDYMQDASRRNWKRAEPEPGYRPWPRELALLHYMSERELGRPSTVVGHAVRTVQRGLVEDTGVAVSLSARGERWLERARQVGVTAGTAKEMERALERPMRDPYARAAEILSEHGMLDSVRKFIRAAVPRPAPELADVEPV